MSKLACSTPPVTDRDLPVEGRDRRTGAALDLRPDDVGIDDCAAVHGADDAANPDSAVPRDFDLGDLRQVAAEGVLKRDPAAVLSGNGCPRRPSSRRDRAPGLARGEFSRCARRKATASVRGGCELGRQSSRHEKAVRDGPTPRRTPVGTPGGSTRTYSTRTLGMS